MSRLQGRIPSEIRKKGTQLVACTAIVMFANWSVCAWGSVLSKMTDQGLYHITLEPESSPAPLRVPHTWKFGIETNVGEFFIPTQLTLDGGMPGHGHGFASQPSVTRYLGEGVFLVEGVTFNMAGRWVFNIAVSGPNGSDTSSIEFELDAEGDIRGVDEASGDAQGTSKNTAHTQTAVSRWTSEQLTTLASLRLSNLAPARDPSNEYADDMDAAKFGHALFYDAGLSKNGQVSCASCHQPTRFFTDGRAKGQGLGVNKRHTPDLVGVAHRSWFYWDGRRDSLWSQALIPLEAPLEMGSSRLSVIRYVNHHYRDVYKNVFGPLPKLEGLPEHAGPFGSETERNAWKRIPVKTRHELNAAFANIGKALAAFEARIDYAPGRFDLYIDAVLSGDPDADNILGTEAQAGLALFLNEKRTMCLRCHNGPTLSNQGFHNIGTGTFDGQDLDFGRVFGLQAVLMDEFNCTGPHSDAVPTDCDHLRYAHRRHVPDNFHGAFKVPSLRNVANTAPYMHDGRFESLREVLDHYRSPPAAALAGGEIDALVLSDKEINQLVAFLKTIDGGIDVPQEWLTPPGKN